MMTESALKKYIKDLTDIALRGDAREESFYSALKDLLLKIASSTHHKHLSVTTMPKKTEGGNPDFRIWDGNSHIVGYIEAKPPTQEDLNHVEASGQLRRYRETFPNLILTNFLEFRLYRNGKRVQSVLIARPVILNRVRTTPPLENVDQLRSLLEQFFDFSLPRTFTAENLAVELAKRTRFLHDIVLRELKEENQTKSKSQLYGFYEAFQKYLIGSLTLEEFADLYAQTTTYGLFAARTRAGNGFSRRSAFENIPHTIGVLRDLFRYISLEDLPPQIEWIVDDIVEVLSVVDASGILARFYREGKGTDPIVHFYETFLARYDPRERERRGVYYTPEPVVNYIVRGLNDLLKSRFDKSDGFASRDVTILDPAAGTMTFIAKAAEEAVHEFEEKYGAGAREAFIKEHILNNFYAFELMMAPYSVGHLKMTFYLDELGHRLGEDERMRFYLTNTLDMRELEESALPGLSSLAEESHLAGEVKRNTPILVILGNPPYSGHSANRGPWIRNLIEDYKQVDGKPLGEKNPKWLQDDYVKFLRFAEWKIDQAGRGVVGMVTNHSYLDNPTFRGMRRHLMKTFDEIYILNLHGNSLKREVCPDGRPDKNVFDIRQGVAIAFFLKMGKTEQQSASVLYAELYGDREEKYTWLQEHSFTKTPWQELTPKPEFYLFVPRDEEALDLYNTFPKITEIFPVNSVGIVTARDRLTVHWKPDEVWTTVIRFTNMDPELARDAYKLGKDARDWKVAMAQDDLNRSGPDRKHIVPILYRPFDVRYTYYTGHSRGFHCRPRPDVMRHMLVGENLALVVPRRVEHIGRWMHCLVTEYTCEHVAVSLKTIDYEFPIHLYPGAEKKDLFSTHDAQEKQSNLNKKLADSLAAIFGRKPTPENILHYIYAILYAPTYREQYSEFLRIDFPRIPFTSRWKLFKKTAAFGERLVALHLLKSQELDKPSVRFEGDGNNRVAKSKRDGFIYKEQESCVYINPKQSFAPVRSEIWEYQIGGYKVAQKWLKDRRERTLSLDEIRTYCRILTALSYTMEIQSEIDDIYPAIEADYIALESD